MAIMRAPHLISDSDATRTRPAAPIIVRIAILVVALLAALGTVLAVPASQAAASPARAEGVDAPHMPAGCFGPSQPGGSPDKPCHFNNFVRSRPTVVLWGDSHAWQYIPALTEAVKGQKVNLVSFVAGSCAPLSMGNREPTGVCERSNVAALAYVTKLKKRGSPVKALLGSNWAGFRIAYRRMQLEAVGIDSGYEPYTKKMVLLSHEGTPLLFKKLGQRGIDVDVIAQAAVVPDHNPDCAAGNDPYQCDIVRWRALREEGRTATWLKGQMAGLTGHKRYIETTDAYCDDLVCHGTLDGIATFFDHLHLSQTRTRTLAPYFRATFSSMKSSARRPHANRL